jgi:hypothetical protein
MIVVYLKGGMGNQMFQYASARGIKEGEIFLFLKHFKNKMDTDSFTYRPYELGVFKNLKILNNSKVTSLILYPLISFIIFIRKIKYKFFYKESKKEDQIIKVPIFNFQIMLGYFIGEKYFKHLKKELSAEFSFPELEKDLMAQKIIETEAPICIHVRRGDFLKEKISKVHQVLSAEYYKNAIKIINDKVSSPEYFVFSDDPEYCEKLFSVEQGKFNIVKNNKGDESWKDMYLMSLCKHHIIANSSFSWWGAWLSKNENQIVIAPENWLHGERNTSFSEKMVPESWIKIP